MRKANDEIILYRKFNSYTNDNIDLYFETDIDSYNISFQISKIYKFEIKLMLLFNEKNGHQGKLSIQGRVQPKKGRIVLFDGNTLHAACPPLSNKPRVVVNINIR